MSVSPMDINSGTPLRRLRGSASGDVEGAVVPEAGAVGGWETFCDRSYYDLWCVRRIGDRVFGSGFHVMSAAEATALKDLLNTLPTGA